MTTTDDTKNDLDGLLEQIVENQGGGDSDGEDPPPVPPDAETPPYVTPRKRESLIEENFDNITPTPMDGSSLASLAPPSSSKSFVQTHDDEKPAAAKQMWNVAGNRARLAHVPIPEAADDEFDEMRKKAGKALRTLMSTYKDQKRDDKIDMGKIEQEDLYNKRSVLKHLKSIVDHKITQSENYRQLGVFTVMIVSYAMLILTLRDTQTSYAVETSLLSVLQEPLKDYPQNLKKEDIYTFLSGLSDVVFKDPVCGDGVCDYPMEYAGFGRFGCIKDCGKAQNISQGMITLSDPEVPVGQDKMSQRIYMIAQNYDAMPEFRWNIFIPRMKDFVYAQDQEVVSNKFITVDLPQGPATVCLFQKNPQYANTSPMAIALMLNMDPSKMPAKKNELKYDYGTFTEALLWNGFIRSNLYVDEAEPFNTTTYPRNPALDQGLPYGLGYSFGTLEGAGAKISGVKTPCMLTLEEIEETKTPGRCQHGNVIWTREDVCYDPAKLQAKWESKCRSCETHVINDIPGDDGTSQIKPELSPNRAVTEGNNLIGSILVTQRRVKSVPCHAEASECDSDCNRTLNQLGPLYQSTQCRGTEYDSAPFGIDPIFLPSSKLFNGKLSKELFYKADDITSPSGVPPGFFSSVYSTGYAVPEMPFSNPEDGVPLYRLYLDARLNSAGVHRAIDYMREGNFITNVTESVNVEFGTFNRHLRHFAWCTISFSFHEGGLIEADYQINSFAMSDWEPDVYKAALVAILCTACFRMLIGEVSELLTAFRDGGLRTYFKSYWNLLDILVIFSLPFSIVFVFAAGRPLLASLNLADYGDIPRVLKNPDQQARIFQTDEDDEFRFLQIRNTMNLFVQMSGVSRIWVGFNILLMTTRFLKALHFQGRMGLVTRTFANALNDIAHFSVIFIFILVMYAIMGQFMFGAQLNSFRELGSSMMMLFTTTLTVGVEDYNSMLSVAPYMAPITTIFWLSFLIISTVVLLNIFLAILVEGFSVVKETAQDSETLVEGFAEIFAHDVSAWWETVLNDPVVRMCVPSNRSRYLSNDRISELLEAWLWHLDKVAGEVQEDEGDGKRVDSNVERVIHTGSGDDISEKELMTLLLALIHEGPERVSQYRRRVWDAMSRAIKSKASMVGSGSKSGSNRASISSKVTPESSVDEKDVEKGQIPVSKRTYFGMGRRSATSSNSFWENLRDEVAPPRRGESMKKLNLSPEAMGVINGAKKIGRLTRQVMGRFGDKVEDEKQAEEVLKVLKGQIMERQIEQFKRVGDIERRVVNVEEKLDSIADLGQTIAAMAIKMGVRPSHRPPAYSSQGGSDAAGGAAQRTSSGSGGKALRRALSKPGLNRGVSSSSNGLRYINSGMEGLGPDSLGSEEAAKSFMRGSLDLGRVN